MASGIPSYLLCVLSCPSCGQSSWRDSVGRELPVPVTRLRHGSRPRLVGLVKRNHFNSRSAAGSFCHTPTAVLRFPEGPLLRPAQARSVIDPHGRPQ